MQADTQKQVIYLKRATYSGGNYIADTDDFITFKEENSDGIQVTYQYTYDGYNQLYMIFPSYLYVTSVPQLIITKEVLDGTDKTITVTNADTDGRYYVYAHGSMQGSYTSPRSAVLEAYENSGRAISSDGRCIWKISGLLEYAEVTEGLTEISCESPEESLQACIGMILRYEGMTVPETYDMTGNVDDILERYLGKTGINLVGCDVDNALYYLCQGAPVIAKLDADTYVLIISYNEATIRYYNPVEGVENRVERYMLEETFAEQGSQFFTYLP
jgi:hypothetical protein